MVRGMIIVSHVVVSGLLAALALAGSMSAASAQSPPNQLQVQGVARVVDGDTIVVAETRVRLEGIDAPETGQVCKRAWIGHWACGTTATSALVKLVENREVVCAHKGWDKYNRFLGVCAVEGRDINAEMVRVGMAWAFVKYSQAYVKEEAEARDAKRGIWQAETQTAWDYRANRWQTAEANVQDGCAIKGNVTKHGRIYHMPWSPWYDKIKIEDVQGKRWFCSEADAVEAGWRPAVVR
jgi:endonuclease YncB( thermonuclease family)